MSSSRRIMKSEDRYDIRDRRFLYNGNVPNNFEENPYDSVGRRPSRQSARRFQTSRTTPHAPPLMEPQQFGSGLHAVSFARTAGVGGLGAATLDHLVNGPDHRAEEPLEGNMQQAKLSYSLAGPFNRKVCPFDIPAEDIGHAEGQSSEYISVPRILSPEASPRGGDSSSESSSCHRLKQKFMKMTPSASVTPGDQTCLINGLSGSTKSLSQLQQKMRNQKQYEKENEDQAKAFRNNGNRFRMKPIDEKPGLRPSATTRKVVEGPSGPQYRGFSRTSGGQPVSRGVGGTVADNHGNVPHRSESHGNLFGGRRMDSQNSLNTIQSQPASGKKPTRKENISTRSWRKGQELILRELGPNKVPATSTPVGRNAAKESVDNDYDCSPNVNNSNDGGMNVDKEETPEVTVVAQPRKRKAGVSKTLSSPAQEVTPSKPKVRHYKVSEIRTYLKKQQEARRRKRQEEEAANQARVEHVRRQIEELRSQQAEAIKKRVHLPPPPVTTEETAVSRPNLNKTFVIESGENDNMAVSDEDFGEEDGEIKADEPMTLEDLETPFGNGDQSPGYQPPLEKYHEVWPSRVTEGVRVPPPTTAYAALSPRSGNEGSLEPPVAVASRLTALEESATLLQSRLWQLAHRFGSNSAGVEEPHREQLAFLSQSVPYRAEPTAKEDTLDPPPPFLSRYDRLTWESKTAANPLEEEPYLPGNTSVPEYPYVPYNFASVAFLDDSTSEASEEPLLPHASAKQESTSHLKRQDPPKRRSSQPLFKSRSPSARRKKIQFKDVPPARKPQRMENDANIREDPYSFMRTYRKQRHLYKLRPMSDDPEGYHTDTTVSDDQNVGLGEANSTETGTTSQGDSEEEIYSDDFSEQASEEKDAREFSDYQVEEDIDEDEYEDDFTSVAAPHSSSQRTAPHSQSETAVKYTGRSNAMSNSDEMFDSEYQRASYDDPSAVRRLQEEEERDEVNELTRPRIQTRLAAAPNQSDQDLPLRLSPGALERRLFAELHYLESVEESVRQLGDIERVRAVSMSQQETVSLAQILKARQLAHNQELRESQMNARQEQLQAANQMLETRQRLGQTTDVTAKTLDQARFAMSANYSRGKSDVAQQVSLSRSTPLPVQSSHAPTSSWRSNSKTSRSKRISTEVDDSSWSKESISAADTDEDESTIQTDTPKHNDHGSGDTDEDVLDHSFRMVLPSEEHRRRGRKAKETAAAAKHNGDSVDMTGEESHTPSFRKFTDDMVRQYMHEEELRAQHQISLLKLRKNALGEKMHTELEFLETQKRQLVKQHGQSRRQQGPYNQFVEKQMALIRRWKQEEGEIDQLLEAQELADRRRQIMLEQDAHIFKMKNESKKIRNQKDPKMDEKGDGRSKRLDKKSLSDWEQKLHVRRQRAEELIRWQEKLKNEELAVKKLEIEAMKIWKDSPPVPDDKTVSDSTVTTEAKPGSSNSSSDRTSGSASSTRRRSSPSNVPSKSDDSEALPRLHIGGVANDSTATISEDVSTDETSTISQESVVLSTRNVKRFDDESSIQEDLDIGQSTNRHDSSNESITEDVAAPSPTPTASIRTETIAGATTATVTESVHTDIGTRESRTRSRSPPSASYGADTFESTSNTTTRLKRRLGDSVVSSLTSPRGPPRHADAKSNVTHQTNARGGVSEDEDSFSCATTTVSEGTEVSDMEGRLHALKEDLKHRVRTLNRLKREKARVNRERLKQKEDLLHKHIEMYDKYITDLKAELDQDVRESSVLDSSLGTPVKPQIKAPRATTRDRSRSSSFNEKQQVPDVLEAGSAVEKSGKDDEDELYSMNFTTSVASEPIKSDKYDDDDDTSSARSEKSRKTSTEEASHKDRDKAESDAKSSSSISEALSKSVGSLNTDRGKSAKTSSHTIEESYSHDFDSEHTNVQKSAVDTASPRELVTEISEHLPSQKSSFSDKSSPRRDVPQDRSISTRRSSSDSSSEVSEHTSERTSSQSRSADGTTDRSASRSAKDRKYSVEDIAESIESLSEIFPSSVETKQESIKSNGAGVGEEVGDSANATPRTPRRLTFSEINEEYSPSEQDTKSKESGDSDGMMIVKPLPNLDLRPVSPESPREKPAPLPPLSPPNDLIDEPPNDDRLPLSARTIHSQMSDIPEDIPSTDHVPSEKTEDDYSYSEEFSAASSSRPPSRSRASEPTSRSRSSSDSSSATVTASEPPEAISSAAPTHTSVPEDVKEVISSDSSTIDPKEVKPKSKFSDEKIAAIVTQIFQETLKDTLSVSLAAMSTSRPAPVTVTEEDVVAIAKVPEHEDETSIEEVFAEPDREGTAQAQDIEEEKDSPRRREESPTLTRSNSMELLAEDVLAEEVDRALAKRRMKRRLSSDADVVSPPTSPTMSQNLNDQDTSIGDTSFSDAFVTSTPATPPVSAPTTQTVDEGMSLTTSFKPEPPSTSSSRETVPAEIETATPASHLLEKSSETSLRPTSPPISLSESSLRLEDERSHFMVPHSRRHLSEMISQAVSDLWPFVCGPDPPRLNQLPSQPSFDFCLVGEAEETITANFGMLSQDVVIRSRRAYKHMVYGLILDTIRRVYAEEIPLRPWMCSRPTRYRLWRDTKPPSTLKKLLSIVEDEIETHMGFSASKKRESKLTQWSRKKRAGLGVSTTIAVDPVDDLLKSELRTEEADWVNYESEEFHVKFQVAEGLLMDLIDDTVQTVVEVRKPSTSEGASLSSIPALLSREIQSGWLDDSNPSLLL